jgi:hypothetical protein
MKITFNRTVKVFNNWVDGTPLELKSMKYTHGVLTHVSVLAYLTSSNAGDTKAVAEITLYPSDCFVIEL